MSDCCSTGSSFPNANLMNHMALNHPVIWAEVCAIQQSILGATSQCQVGGGKMCTTVGGNTPMTHVSSITDLTLIHGGQGYFVDEPTVKIIHPMFNDGIPAKVEAYVNHGKILHINIIDGGSGYETIYPTVNVVSVNGRGAVIDLVVDSHGGISDLAIIETGTGYLVGDRVRIQRPGGISGSSNCGCYDANIEVSEVTATGQIRKFNITCRGNGYCPKTASVVVVSKHNNNRLYPIGDFFEARVYVDNTGSVNMIQVTNEGSGYYPIEPSVYFTDVGTGASAKVTVDNGTIKSVTLDEGGGDYTQNTKVEVYNPITDDPPYQPADKAIIKATVSENKFGTNPMDYYKVFMGVTDDKQIELQMNAVMTHFVKLGYTVEQLTNPDTGNTFMWKLCW